MLTLAWATPARYEGDGLKGKRRDGGRERERTGKEKSKKSGEKACLWQSLFMQRAFIKHLLDARCCAQAKGTGVRKMQEALTVACPPGLHSKASAWPRLVWVLLRTTGPPPQSPRLAARLSATQGCPSLCPTQGCPSLCALCPGLSFRELPPGARVAGVLRALAELLRRADALGAGSLLCLQRPLPVEALVPSILHQGRRGSWGPRAPRAPGHRGKEARSLQATEGRSPLPQPPPRPSHTSPPENLIQLTDSFPATLQPPPLPYLHLELALSFN